MGLGLRRRARELDPDEAVLINERAVSTLPDLPELPPGRGRDENVNPRLELLIGMTYREARSVYRSWRVQRRKLERSKQKSTFVAGRGSRDAAMDAITKARTLEVRLYEFVESFIDRSMNMDEEDEGLQTLASKIKAALLGSGDFVDVMVLDDGDGPIVRAYEDDFGHEFTLIIEPS